MSAEDFLREIAAEPDDDALRLAYSDWLEEQGDPLGEFIRVQCRMAQMPLWARSLPALRRREAQLLSAHRTAWLSPLAGRSGQAFEFRRGVIESWSLTEVPGQRNQVDMSELLARVPTLRAVEIRGSPDRMLPALLRAPDFARIGELTFHTAPSDESLHRLAEREIPLRALTIPVGPRTRGNGLDRLARTAGDHLRRLRIVGSLTPAIQRAAGLFEQVTHLEVDASAEYRMSVLELVKSATFSHLESLTLRGVQITQELMLALDDSGLFTHLETLICDDCAFANGAMLRLQRVLGLNRLTGLSVAHSIAHHDLASFLMHLGQCGAPLRALDLNCNGVSPKVFQALRDSRLLGRLSAFAAQTTQLSPRDCAVIVDSPRAAELEYLWLSRIDQQATEQWPGWRAAYEPFV